MVLGEEDHRDIVIFSLPISIPIKGTYYHMTIIIDVNLDHLAWGSVCHVFCTVKFFSFFLPFP